MNNFDVIVWVVMLIVLGIGAIYQFVKLGKDKQIDKIKEWLLYACIEAEKTLGNKTGKIKLRFVYDMFISKYSFLSKLISFELFSTLVDEALEQMRNLIDTNEAIANYIGGDK